MQPIEDLAAELKEQVRKVKEETEMQKKAANFLQGFTEQCKSNWAKELKDEEIKIRESRKVLNEAENRNKALTAEYAELKKKCEDLGEENEKLEKAMQSLKKSKLQEEHGQETEKNNLANELEILKEQKENLKMWNDIAKASKNKDMAVFEKKMEDEYQVKVQELSNKLDQELEDHKDLIKGLCKSQKQEIKELKESLLPLKFECDDMQKKNRDLEKQIELLKKEMDL